MDEQSILACRARLHHDIAWLVESNKHAAYIVWYAGWRPTMSPVFAPFVYRADYWEQSDVDNIHRWQGVQTFSYVNPLPANRVINGIVISYWLPAVLSLLLWWYCHRRLRHSRPVSRPGLSNGDT